MKARKKPVTIEYFPVSLAIEFATYDWYSLPTWLIAAYEKGDILFLNKSVSIHTLKGHMTGDIDDLIIQGVHGELYAIKPDIFKETYDLVID